MRAMNMKVQERRHKNLFWVIFNDFGLKFKFLKNKKILVFILILILNFGII